MIIPKNCTKNYTFGRNWYPLKGLTLYCVKAVLHEKKEALKASSVYLLLVCRIVVEVSLNEDDWCSLVAGA